MANMFPVQENNISLLFYFIWMVAIETAFFKDLNSYNFSFQNSHTS